MFNEQINEQINEQRFNDPKLGDLRIPSDSADAQTEDRAGEEIEDFKGPNVYSLRLRDLEDLFRRSGKESYRAQQIFKWIYERGQDDPLEMSNLSKEFRMEVKRTLGFQLPPLLSRKISLDGTQKFLFAVTEPETHTTAKFKTGNLSSYAVESVLIPSEGRLTLCVSSELGCNMACRFCFTGKTKLQKRLSVDQIVGQVQSVQRILDQGQGPRKGPRISNIVFMGMGEPLDNSEAVFKAIEILHSPWGLNLSRRRITVSTSGIVPEIPRVAAAGVRLAVSLNASNDQVRSKIMPINLKWPLAELLGACREFVKVTKDKITFEYVLLKGVTDQLVHARELVRLLRGIPSKINLIPFNEHPGSGFERPSDEQVRLFHKELMDSGAHVLLRRTMGRDIYAACGQLAGPIRDHPETMDISNSALGGRK